MTASSDAASDVARKVLIAANDDDLRRLLRLAVGRDARLELLDDAATADEALDRAAALRPDLILLDELLGEVRGIDLAEDLTAAVPRAMILLLTTPFAHTAVRSLAIDGVLAKDGLRALPAVAARMLELDPLED